MFLCFSFINRNIFVEEAKTWVFWARQILLGLFNSFEEMQLSEDNVCPFYFADGPILNRERSASKTIFSALGSNEQITLNCVFDGFPAPRVRFKKMGKVLNNSGISYGSGTASYKFSVKSENDFGFYTCDASNSRGCAFHYIEVYKTGS